MVGTLKYNEYSKRFFIVLDNDFVFDITSGNEIIIYYEDLKLVSSVEHDGKYYLTKYPKISLNDLVGSKVEIL